MQQELARAALDKKLQSANLGQLHRPHKGWIRAVREALGMSSAQLAQRLGVSRPRITALEKSEMDDSITLGTLRRAATAMECTLVYALVPRTSFEDTLQTRAKLVARKLITDVDHSMALEAQNLDLNLLEEEIEKLSQNLIREKPNQIWKEPQ